MDLKLPQAPPDLEGLFPTEPLFLMERGMLLECLYLIHLYGFDPAVDLAARSCIIIGSFSDKAMVWLKKQVDLPIQHYPSASELPAPIQATGLLISFVELADPPSADLRSKVVHLIVPFNGLLQGIYYCVPYTDQILVKYTGGGERGVDIIPQLKWHRQRREYMDWDQQAERKILALYPATTLSSLNEVAPIPVDARVSPLMLAKACLNRDFDTTRQCLISDLFVIDDNLYRYNVTTFNFGDLLHNDSALIKRAAGKSVV